MYKHANHNSYVIVIIKSNPALFRLCCDSDLKLGSLCCFIIQTEKDAPRSGEGRWGGEEQNHRELEDGSEDATHEVDRVLLCLLYPALRSLCSLRWMSAFTAFISPLTLSVTLFTYSQTYVNESFKNWTNLKVTAALVKDFSLMAAYIKQGLWKCLISILGTWAFQYSKCPELLMTFTADNLIPVWLS